MKCGKIIVSCCFFLGFLTAGKAAFADSCPVHVYYRSGALLKSGTSYYYQNSAALVSGSSAYYPNGHTLKSGSSFYFPNANALVSGSSIYYPNGNTLKSGTTFYYENGHILKSGSTFYHPGGNVARSGTSLYRVDGSPSEFPLNLRQMIEHFGFLTFEVRRDSEQVELNLTSLISSNEVRGGVYDDGVHFSLIFAISTGAEGEYLSLRLDEDGGSVCELSGDPGTRDGPHIL